MGGDRPIRGSDDSDQNIDIFYEFKIDLESRDLGLLDRDNTDVLIEIEEMTKCTTK